MYTLVNEIERELPKGTIYIGNLCGKKNWKLYSIKNKDFKEVGWCRIFYNYHLKKGIRERDNEVCGIFFDSRFKTPKKAKNKQEILNLLKKWLKNV